MMANNQIPYLLEGMQPYWLDGNSEKQFHVIMSLVYAMISGISIGVFAGQFGTIIGIAFGCMIGLSSAYTYKGSGIFHKFTGIQYPDIKKISMMDTFRWEKKPFRNIFPERLFMYFIVLFQLIFQLICCMGLPFFGLFIYDFSQGYGDLSFLSQNILLIIFLCFIFPLYFGLFIFLWIRNVPIPVIVERQIRSFQTPGQKIFLNTRIAITAILVGLLVGLVGGYFWNGVAGSIINGFAFGTLCVLFGFSVIQHYLLRLFIIRNQSFPFKLVPFLNYCVDLIFLRRVGGGYIFVHRLLMEHFAAIYPENAQSLSDVRN